MANRLKESLSPYLLQHANQPVDWFPWGEEAFEKARTENKPVFLSVGYSSCHWCHVMAHESFDDLAVAEVLNRSYVAIKVDREERPDIDEVYMTAVQLSSGRGGWPMSVFLTPEKDPFLAGTYFPKEDRGGKPGFHSFCLQIEEGWKFQEADIRAAARDFAEALTRSISTQPESDIEHWTAADVHEAVSTLWEDFDREHGGFGGAPKFPPHSALWFLTDYLEWTADEEGKAQAQKVVSSTLDALTNRGLFDHVGGGFHRYSTDAEWHLPHFEKMLYDNAWMLWNLGRAGMANSFAVVKTVEWLRTEMSSNDGLLYTALDADSEGVEGKFYVWTCAEIIEILGERAEAFIAEFGFSPKGNFYDEASHSLTGENLLDRKAGSGMDFAAELEGLKEIRSKRVRPQTDDKCLLASNGMATMGLHAVGEEKWARDILLKVLEFRTPTGDLPRYVKDGKAVGQGFLDDYVFIIAGLILVDELDPAIELFERALSLFWDQERGALTNSGSVHEKLFGATLPVFDQPIPSANAMMLWAALKLKRLDVAESLLRFGLPWMHRAPHATEAFFAACLPLIDPHSGVKSFRVGDQNLDLRPRDVEVELLQGPVREDGMDFVIVLTLPEGWSIVLEPQEGRLPALIWVEGADYQTLEPVMSGSKVEFPLTLTALSSDRPKIHVRYQACTDSTCLLPMTRSFDLQFA